MIEDIKTKALQEKVPIIKDDGLAFILEYIQKYDCKQILELGTAVGYSAINMVDTIEKNIEMYKQAIVNIKECNLDKQITVYNMAIEDFHSDKLYDLIFVDAAKAQYQKYLEMFIDNLKEDGAMIFDNMVFHGLVFEVDQIQSKNLRNLVKKIKLFRENVQNDNRFDIMLSDNIGDGILVLTRRKDET